MGRIFSALTVVAVLLIIISGAGAYWVSSSSIAASKEESATVVAKSAILSISAQIALLNSTLDKMAQDPEVVAAANRADPVLLNTVTDKLEKHFPNALKIRVLLPGVSQPDDKSMPPMGFADLDMVRESFTKVQLPAIQGDNGPNRHLAITSRIMQNGKVIGVILASLNYDFIRKSFHAATTKDVYIELRQGSLVLASSGEKIDMQNSDIFPIKIPNTDWELHYQYKSSVSASGLITVASIIVVAALLAMTAILVGYRKLSDLLAQDLHSVMKAFKDMMTLKLPGNYPVNLSEMNAVISTLIQFKRVLDNEEMVGDRTNADMSIVVNDDEDFDMDSFFDISEFKP